MSNSDLAIAKLSYSANDFKIVEMGDYVLCGVTDDPIPLELLRYWCVETQMPFRDVHVANAALAPKTAPKIKE